MPSKILVIDGHYVSLMGTLIILEQKFVDIRIITAQTSQDAQKQIIYSDVQYDLVIVEIALPENTDGLTKINTGIKFLEKLMTEYPTINIVVQSPYTKSLIRIKSIIENHQGGFTVVDKRCSSAEQLLKNIDLSLQGIVHLPHELRFTFNVDSRWLHFLKLAFEESLTDKQIANNMNITQRTVRNYWLKIRDLLEVDPNYKQNVRILIGIRARQEGLID